MSRPPRRLAEGGWGDASGDGAADGAEQSRSAAGRRGDPGDGGRGRVRRADHGERVCVCPERGDERGFRGVLDRVVGPGRSGRQRVFLPAHGRGAQRWQILQRGGGPGARRRPCGRRSRETARSIRPDVSGGSEGPADPVSLVSEEHHRHARFRAGLHASARTA